MEHVSLALLAAASASATAFAWWRIFVSADPTVFKFVLAAIAAVPVLGPLLWLFIASMPTRRFSRPSSAWAGPVSPSPTRPRWLASSHKAIAYAAALVIIGIHIALLAWLLK